MSKFFLLKMLLLAFFTGAMAAWCHLTGDQAELKRVLWVGIAGLILVAGLEFFVVRRRRPEDKEAGVDTSGQGRD